MRPDKQNQKKFDFDMSFGEWGEDTFLHMMGMTRDKFEIKTEGIEMWTKWGNIAVEYQCFDKPSGINATEAAYWVQNLADRDNDMYCTIIFPTAPMKKVLDKMQPRQVTGGDFNKSEMYLVSLADLFSKKAYK